LSRLLEGDFVQRRENVLAFGNPGSGKSHLLCALGLELVRRGYTVIVPPMRATGAGAAASQTRPGYRTGAEEAASLPGNHRR
jgi:predicted alpha/beta-fold hydrolase